MTEIAAGKTNEFTPPAVRLLTASIVAQLFGGTMVIGLLPLLMAPISKSLGWSGIQMGIMAGATLISAAIGLPICGYLVDRFGPRPVVMIGAMLTGLGLFGLAAQSGSIVQGVFSFALAGFLSATSVAHVKTQAQQFDRSRGVVLAILGMTVGVSFGLTPLFGKVVLDAYGWRAVYAAFALLPIFVTLPICFVWFRPQASLSSRPGHPGTGPNGTSLGEAMRSRRFWSIVFMAAASAFVFAGMQSNFVNVLAERGFDNQSAVNILSIAVLGGLISQLLTGWLLDRWRTPRAAIPFIAVALLGMILLMASKATWATTVGVVLLQSGVGGELSIIPYLVSRAFGGGHMARIFGTIMLIAQVISGGSPVLMGAVHDSSGSYAPALPVFAALLALSLVTLYFLGGILRADAGSEA